MKKQLIFGSFLAFASIGYSQIYTPSGVIQGSSGALNNNVGIGATSPGKKLEVSSSSAEDGIRITQIGTGSNVGASALHMKNMSTGGHYWSLFSLGSGNSAWGAGNFVIGGSGDYGDNYNSLFLIQKNTGNVGIGLTAPATKLDVDGSGRFSTNIELGPGPLNPLIPLNISQGSGQYDGIRFSAQSSGRTAFEIVQNPTPTFSRFKTFADGKTYIGAFTSPVYNPNGSILTIGQTIVADKAISVINSTDPSASDVFSVYGNGKTIINGNVGVGTSTPGDKLQVGDSWKKLAIGSAEGVNLAYGTSYLGFNASRQNLSTWTISNDGVHNGGGVIFGDVSGNMYFSAIPNTGSANQTLSDAAILNNSIFKIKSSTQYQSTGMVQIGGALPGNNVHAYNTLLSVNGKLLAKEIVVTIQNWPDYVFDKNYKLKSLESIENYIKENNHLPNMPSANEVAANGISISEISKLQMEKIEELTLYVIELRKEMEILKKKVDNNK